MTPKPRTKLLGIDFGTVRIGLAVCDAERRIASPLDTYTRRSPDADGVYFKELIEAEEIGGLVVGLPLHTDGRESAKSKEVRVFGAWLETLTGLSVTYFDERFTTVFAEEALWNAGLSHKKRKERRDRVAAQMMLQAFLEQRD